MAQKPEIKFAQGALPADADQELIDAITAAIQAQLNGEELPDGVEFTEVTELEFDEEEIAQALAQYSYLPQSELKALEVAMREGDADSFVEILTAAAMRDVKQ